MNARKFREALDVLELNNSQAAHVLGIGRASVVRYVYNKQSVPEVVEKLLVMLQKHGIPKDFWT